MLRRTTTPITTTLAATALAAATLVAVAPSSAAAETCQGRPATIVGTDRTVAGTPGDDVIVSGTASSVDAGPGADLVCVSGSSSGYVAVLAGDGDDVVDTSATSGPTWTLMGAGRDRHVGGPGEDEVHALGSDDDLAGGAGTDLLVALVDSGSGTPGAYAGGEGRDLLHVWSQDLDLEVELDGQVLVGGVPAASNTGFEGASVSAPRAVLVGTGDDDYLSFAGCEVEVRGRGGDDILSGRRIAEDAPVYACRSRVRADAGPGDDRIAGSLGADRLSGGAGHDEVEGRSAADVLLGGRGRDSLKGGGDGDVIRGGSGRDTLVGNPGRDTLLGNGGRDTADGYHGRDRCVAERERRCER